MNSTKPIFPTISPADIQESRPFWSVMIPTYNGTQYLAQTLKSVLQQDPGVDRMQIEVVDDCSTNDDPESLVKEIGQGRVSFYRNPQNLGLLANWDACIQRSRGQWVHLLHQDDLVLPGFYEQLQKGIESEPSVGAAFSRFTYFDEDGFWTNLAAIERKTPGILENWLEIIATQQRIQFPAIAVRRTTYEKLGGFCPQARSAADWEMWKRIATNYPIWYESQILACFRLHSNSTSSGLIQRGENIADTYRAIDVSSSYLPQETVGRFSRNARNFYAKNALTMAHKMLDRNEVLGAIAQLRQGLKFYPSPGHIQSGLFAFVRIVKKQFWQKNEKPK